MLRPDLRKDTRDLEAQQADFLASRKTPAARVERVAESVPKPRRSVTFEDGTKEAAPSAPAPAPAQRVVGAVVEHMAVGAQEQSSRPVANESLVVSVSRTGFPDVHDVDLTSFESGKPSSNVNNKNKRKPSLFAKFLQSKNNAVPPSASSSLAPIIGNSAPENQTGDAGGSDDIPSSFNESMSVRFGAADDSIHNENMSRVAAMSDAEREEATRALFEKFDPDLLKGLLQRAQVQEANATTRQSSNVGQQESRGEVPKKQQPEQEVQQSSLSNTAEAQAVDDTIGINNDADLSWIRSDQDLAMAAQRLPASEKQKLRWMQPSLFADQDISPADAETETNAPSDQHRAPVACARFTLSGQLVAADLTSSSEQASANTQLFHHGDEPDRAGYTVDELVQLMRSTVAGQRILALRALEGVFRMRQECLWSSKQRHAQTLLPEELPLLLRCALDDSIPAVSSCAINALYEYLVPTEHERQRLELSELDTCQTLAWAPVARAQGAQEFYGRAADFGSTGAGMGGQSSDDEDEDEDEDAGDGKGPREGVIRERPTQKNAEEDEDVTDTDRLLVSPVRGMIHTGLLHRLSYLLGCEDSSRAGSCVLTPQATTKSLGVLLHLARHSRWAAKKIVQHPHLIRGVVDRFVVHATAGWVSDDATAATKPEFASSKSGTPANDKTDARRTTSERTAGLLQTALAVEMLNTLAMHQRTHVMQLNRGGVLNATRRYIGLACDAFPFPSTRDGEENSTSGRADQEAIISAMSRVLRAVLGLWSTALSYGIDASDLLSFLPLLQRLHKHFPSVKAHVNLLMARFMRFCLDDLRELDDGTDGNGSEGANHPNTSSLAAAAADVTTEIGERLAHTVTGLVLNDNGEGDSWVHEASALRVAEAFGRLLIGPQGLALWSVENVLSTPIGCGLGQQDQVGKQCESLELDLKDVELSATAAGVRRSVGMALAQVATKVCRTASVTRVEQALESVYSSWPMPLNAQVSDSTETTEWLLALISALNMCAGSSYGLVTNSATGPVSLDELLCSTPLLRSVLPGFLNRMVEASRADMTNTKVLLEPRRAAQSRTVVLLMLATAELLIRVRGSIAPVALLGGHDDVPTAEAAGPQAPEEHIEARARRRLVIELVRRGAVYKGDEWLWRNLLGALLTPSLLGIGSNPRMNKNMGELLAQSGRPELIRVFTNVLHGDEAISNSFARYHHRVSRVRTLTIGRPTDNLGAMSEAGGAWPVLSLRMASDPAMALALSATDKHMQQEVVWLSLNLAHVLQDDMPRCHLLVLVLRMLTNAQAEWTSEPRVEALVAGLMSTCTSPFSSSATDSLNKTSLHDQLVRVVGGTPALGALASQLVTTFVDNSFGNRATCLGVLVFLRADFASTPVYEEVLSEVCMSGLLHVLGTDEGGAQVLPQDDTFFAARAQVSERAAQTWGSALARGAVTRERGSFGYWLAVHHVAVVGSEGWLGARLVKEMEKTQPGAAEDVRWYERAVASKAITTTAAGGSHAELLKAGLGV